MAKFILSDESVNRYGFRVLTSGIDIEDFKKNPVMLYNHKRSLPYSGDECLPIGKWDNIQMEGGKLTAEAVFDDNDDFAQQIKSKVEAGILNAASLSFDVVSISEDQADLVTGQTRPTVTKCKALEASIVDLPGNAGALRMNFREKGVSLSADAPKDILNTVLPTINLELNMSKVAVKLGLGADATEDQIVAALETKLSASATDLQAQKDALIGEVISLGKAKGVVNDKNEDKVKRMAKADFTLALEYINDLAEATGNSGGTEHVSLVKTIEEVRQQGNGAAADERSKWTYDDWAQKDSKALSLMKTSEPQKFQKLLDEKLKEVDAKGIC